MFLTHFDVFCNVLPNRPTQQRAIYLLSTINSSQKVFSQTFHRYTFLCVMLNLIEVSTMLHAKLLLISIYSPTTISSSNKNVFSVFNEWK